MDIKSVRGWLATHEPGSIVEKQTFYNKRFNPKTGRNEHAAYRLLVEKYAEVHEVKFNAMRQTQKDRIASTSVLFTDEEILSVEDFQVRYKIQLMQGKLRSLMNQLNSIRRIENMPLISSQVTKRNTLGNETDSPISPENLSVALEEFEVDAVVDFLSADSLRNRRLSFDEVGALSIQHSPRKISSSASKPFLRDALEKIAKSHGRIAS